MTIKAGILSDTHLSRVDDVFRQQVELCFAGCEVIIHAGDLTDISVLDAFNGKKVYAVHGNMCGSSASLALPGEESFELERLTIGLTHGSQLGRDIEGALLALFPAADCIVYGHTHRPVCHSYGGTLVINPGSFRGTGRFGAPGTYAILEIDDRLRGSIHEVPRL
ncbi:phosphodiesterase YfcE [bacterium BMS3Bbin14]|nr:phosphodiesterase YfcE [bacterium BMS3Abin13]GBE52040.1 phosphodiesterase YfcE [bacterium BMS3Bbin14]